MKVNFEAIHTYYKSLELGRYINEICDCGEIFTLAQGENIDVNQGYVYIVLNGSVAICHQKSNLTIGNAIEFMPIGLMEEYCPLLHFEYKCMTPLTAVKIPCMAFTALFYQSPEHMGVLSKILVFMTIFSLDLLAERKQPTSYQTIKPMLQRYLYRTQTFENEMEGLANFIIRRTKLSRTHVFRVLANLKKGGYITMEKGKLISINKTLPEDY